MPIGAIISQPESNGLKAAYRPVVLRVAATKTDNSAQPPVVYCDVYFNDIFYKTISKTQYQLLTISNSEWQFDIQDAAQEYLQKFLGSNGEAAIVEATPIISRVFCRFRSSGIDVSGFITTENTAPVQGTSSSDPVSGTGTESNSFYILNATLQHEDAQDLSNHLNSFKRRTWADTTWPLSHRPDNYKLCLEDSDVFPIAHSGNDLLCLKLNYRNKGQAVYNSATVCGLQTCPIPGSPVEISVIDNGDDTQTFTFNWGTIDSPSAQFDIQYRIANSVDAWTSNIGSIIPTRAITLPIGLYDFRFAGVGDCNTVPSAEYEDYGISVCIPVAIVSSSVLPNGQVGVSYNVSISLSGTGPFAIENPIKPSWMSITVLGSTVQITGTPTDPGTDIPVSFDITNCGGGDSVSVNSPIDVVASAISTFTNNSASSFFARIRINLTYWYTPVLAPGETFDFITPELALGAGYDLMVYTSTFLMTNCAAVSNSVNIPMLINNSGPGTHNVANNVSTFAIVNGIQITVN